MKIAFIVDSFPSLSETFILNQISGLIDLGHNVEIFSGSRPSESKFHPEVQQYHLLKQTNYYNEPPNNYFHRLWGAARMLPSCIRINFLATLNSLNFIKQRRNALSMRIIYKIKHFLDKGPFDIIYCHFGPNGIQGTLLKRLGIKGKVITTFHGYDLSSYLVKNGSNIYDLLFQDGDLFLPISVYWRNKLLNMGCPSDKIKVHHMGIDLDKFKFLPRKLSPGEPIRLLTIARLVEKKGIFFSIQAVADILSKRQDIEYLIVGDGPLRKELTTQINQLGVAKQVKLLGWQSADSTRSILEKAHIMILHSITSKTGDTEGIPVSLMEAMAMGLPVISTWHTGIPELIQDGHSGYLVKEKDMYDLNNKILVMIKNPSIWLEFGSAGREVVERDFNIKKLNKQFIDLCESLLADNVL